MHVQPAPRTSLIGRVPVTPRERCLALGAGGALAAYLLMILWVETSTVAVDQAVRSLVHAVASPLLHGPMEAVSWLGRAEGVIVLIALGSASLWRYDRCSAMVLPALMAGSGALQLIAKWAIDRPRPDLTPWGFPSGHVLSLVVFFGFLAYVIHGSGIGPRWRRIAAILCAVPVVAVAYSRLYLDRHWLSDLVGGFAIGLAYLLCVVLIVEWARAPRAEGEVAAIGSQGAL